MLSLFVKTPAHAKAKRKSALFPKTAPLLCQPFCLSTGRRSPALEQQTTQVDLFTTIPPNAIRLICLWIVRGQGAQTPAEDSPGFLLQLRLLGRVWLHAVPPVVAEALPHTRLVVPRGTLEYCSPAFLARTVRAFKKPAPEINESNLTGQTSQTSQLVLDLRIGRGTEPGLSGLSGLSGLGGRKVSSCYPGPMAMSAIAGSPDIDGVAVTLRLSRKHRKKVPIAHLSSLSALLAAGKIVSLCLGTETDRCSYAELLEIVRVFRVASQAGAPTAALAISSLRTLEACRARVRSLEITQNPVLLGQTRGAGLFATLLSILPNLERLAIDHSCTSTRTFRLLAPTIARMSRLTSLTLDGSNLDPGRFSTVTVNGAVPIPFAVISLPPTLVRLSLSRISVGPAYFAQLLAGIGALESITSCNLSGALMCMADAACIAAIVALVNKKTVRCLDLSCNTLFANRYTPDRQFARSLLASETLHSLTVSSVCTPPHVIEALITALPATRLVHLEISRGVYSTVISDLAVELLRAAAPGSCTLEVGPHVTSWY